MYLTKNFYCKVYKELNKLLFLQLTENMPTPILTKEQIRRRMQPKPDMDNPRTAFDLALKIRRELKEEKKSRMHKCGKGKIFCLSMKFMVL